LQASQLSALLLLLLQVVPLMVVETRKEVDEVSPQAGASAREATAGTWYPASTLRLQQSCTSAGTSARDETAAASQSASTLGLQ
jgi:hypothetical protein